MITRWRLCRAECSSVVQTIHTRFARAQPERQMNGLVLTWLAGDSVWTWRGSVCAHVCVFTWSEYIIIANNMWHTPHRHSLLLCPLEYRLHTCNAVKAADQQHNSKGFWVCSTTRSTWQSLFVRLFSLLVWFDKLLHNHSYLFASGSETN